MSYQQSRNAMGHLVIHRVPIFVECERGETNYDAEWLSKAVKHAKVAELEGYFPPLHIRHHGDGEVRAAGFFKITGTGPLTFKGSTCTAVFADLVITAPWVEDDVLQARLPYRSVEIFNVDAPAFDSLALLDHEPPYLEMPMLMVAQQAPGTGVDDSGPAHPGQTPGMLVPVANATFANPWLDETRKHDSMVVACFQRGSSAHFLFQDENEPMAAKKLPNSKPAAGTQFADDGDKKDGPPKKDEGESKKDGEEMEGDGSLDVGAVCKAISDGSITVADMEEIKAAIIAQQGAVGEEAEEPAAAPAPTPGEAMSKTPQDAAKFASMQGEIDALKALNKDRDATDSRKDAVADALQRLEGRPLGSDIKDKLTAFHKDHGPEAFDAYVETLAKTFGKLTDKDVAAMKFSGQGDSTPEAAMAYSEQGTDAVAKATKFAAEHDELAKRGHTRKSQAAYVESNMCRNGFKAPRKAAS